jgi:hypothetical protein
MRALPALVLGAALAVSGCTAHRVETPSAAPKTTAAKARTPPSSTAKPQAAVPVGVPAAAPPEAGSPGSPAPAGVPSDAAAAKSPAAKAPPATESSYVYAPQQAAVASHPAPAIPGGSARPPAGAPREAAPAAAPADSANEGPGQIQLSVVASAAEIATGTIMTVDVMAASNRAVVDAPLHLTFDPNVVEFVDGTVGDFLAQGGSSVVFFADGRSRPGDVAVAAGRVERAQGAKGSGLLCRVRFRGTAAGTTPLAVGRAKAWGVNGEELAVSSAGANVVVH